MSVTSYRQIHKKNQTIIWNEICCRKHKQNLTLNPLKSYKNKQNSWGKERKWGGSRFHPLSKRCKNSRILLTCLQSLRSENTPCIITRIKKKWPQKRYLLFLWLWWYGWECPYSLGHLIFFLIGFCLLACLLVCLLAIGFLWVAALAVLKLTP